MDTSFAVKVNDFEGPLDLLLNLIEDRKMLISDVSLSSVADDFLKYIQVQGAFPVGQAAHFVLVAATLLLIKSRALLPVLSLTNEEEGDVKDLEFRLSLLQFFRNVAKGLNSFSSHMYFGGGARVVDPVFTPAPDISVASLREAMDRALKEAPQVTFAPEVSVKKVMSLEEMIDTLSERMQKAIQMTFKDFSANKTDPREVVVGFLAMLELVKRGLMLVQQEQSFGDITMSYSGSIQAPRYE